MNAMLASVRNLDEARMALDGGCDWLDIKEPAQGALGQVALEVVSEIVELAAARVPVSATIGDRWDQAATIPDAVIAMSATGVDYVKVGLRARGLYAATRSAMGEACAGARKVIAVCMAEAPPTRADIASLAACGVRGVMLDTMDKHGPGLTGLLADQDLRDFVSAAREWQLLVGLAGRLKREDIARLAPCGADYLGFRSALCAAGERRASLDALAFAAVRAALNRAQVRNTNNASEVN
ncbi:MAG: hypothetical protein IT492_04790 [Gammaproteobacteria bacterium]|nr:hypothetical protein [Gammaproteobacteria bacterium]